MIYSFIHPGSGLGNQLFRYVAGKVLALDKGYEYSAIGRENFKGKSFMNLDFGYPNTLLTRVEMPAGKIVVDHVRGQWEEKTPYYNPEFNFIEDNTIIDGEFQDERYFGDKLYLIDRWLKVEPLEMPEDVCVIGFRGGEFYTVPELGLPKSYYDEAIGIMRGIDPDMRFEVHTDDEMLAKQFFPDFKIIHDIGINWRSVKCAQFAIIANSSFYILPRLLGGGLTIAPRYWDRYNIKKWERPYNYYDEFTYI